MLKLQSSMRLLLPFVCVTAHTVLGAKRTPPVSLDVDFGRRVGAVRSCLWLLHYVRELFL